MKKLAITALGVLALAASANAQGTWYTDKALWLSRTTVVNTADYNSLPNGFFIGPYTEAGVTATVASGFYTSSSYPALSTNNASTTPLGFTFSGNAFGGMFGMTDASFNWITDGMNFSVDGSVTNVYSITSPSITNTYTFLGYISDSSSPISVTVSGDATPQYVTVDSFSFGNGTNPAGASVAPEPGTLALALTGAYALVGMYIRRRRMSN